MGIEITIDYDFLATKIVEKMQVQKVDEEKKPSQVIRGIRELASYLQISSATAQRLKNDGKIPYTTLGSRVFFNSADADKILGR